MTGAMNWLRFYQSKGKTAAQTPRDDSLVNQINWEAVRYARERASDPDPAWRLLWQVVAEGLVGNVGQQGITANLAARGYSREDAEAWAHHAVAECNSRAALAGYLEAERSGIKLKKEWLATRDCCSECQANEAQGPIALSLPFKSGHLTPPAHFGCRCALSPAVRS